MAPQHIISTFLTLQKHLPSTLRSRYRLRVSLLSCLELCTRPGTDSAQLLLP